MTTRLSRVRAAGEIRLARGDTEQYPQVLLGRSVTVASLLADPGRPLQDLAPLRASGPVPGLGGHPGATGSAARMGSLA